MPLNPPYGPFPVSGVPHGGDYVGHPSSGSGDAANLRPAISDALGATDLSTVGFSISTASTVAACAVDYNRAQNTLSLFTDAGAGVRVPALRRVAVHSKTANAR